VDRIDHFGASALALAYEKNISIEEATEILFEETLKLHNEFLNSHTDTVQVKKNNTSR
jgi:hypothetical protein